MAEEEIEEDTYSLILASLKHPLRRKILRMLSEGPLSFSQILESLAIDSGHLNYHIKNLGDLLSRSEEGKYMLSNAGWAAIKLMGQVEEQEESAKISRRRRRISRTAIAFSVLFAVALLLATVYALTYTAHAEFALFQGQLEKEKVPVAIQHDQQFRYRISLILRNESDGSILYSIRNDETLISTQLPTSNIVQRTEYYSDTHLMVNGTYAINITVFDVDGNILFNHREEGVADILSSQSIPIVFDISKLGTYTLQVDNLREEIFNTTLVPRGVMITYSRPLFYYGVVGVIFLLLYPILLSLSWNFGGKQKKTAA